MHLQLTVADHWATRLANIFLSYISMFPVHLSPCEGERVTETDGIPIRGSATQTGLFRCLLPAQTLIQNTR